jgi:hypothetical protein
MCVVSGTLYDGGGAALPNTTVLFFAPQQVIGGSTIAASTVSTRSDSNGVLTNIALPMTAVVQITIGQGMVVTGIVPNAATADIAAVITGTVFSGVPTGLSLQTNGVANQNQTFLNLINGNGVITTNTLGGAVQFTVDTGVVFTNGGGTITGPLVIHMAQPTMYLEDSAVGGGEFAIQTNTNALVIFHNDGTHGTPNFLPKYSLQPTGTPVNANDLIPKGFSDTTYFNKVSGDTTLGPVWIQGATPQIRFKTTVVADQWLMGPQTGLMSFYVNTGTDLSPTWTARYNLNATGSPVNAGDLATKFYVDNINVGASQLKTSNGSMTTAGSPQNVLMNNFSFFPSFTATGSSAAIGTYSGQADPVDQVGRCQLPANSVMRWLYLTGSDNPRIWLVYNPTTGVIDGAWCSDDPTPNDAPGVTPIPPSTDQVIGYTPTDLQYITLSAASLHAADVKIATENLNPANRLYRALQIQANDSAPGPYLIAHCKIDIANKLLVDL